MTHFITSLRNNVPWTRQIETEDGNLFVLWPTEVGKVTLKSSDDESL
jgi:hypothetical protein